MADDEIDFEEDMDLEEAEAFLAHEGTPRHSGRYPYGSGDNPHQHYKDFLANVDALKKQGLSPAEIAQGMGLGSTTRLRAVNSIAKNEKRAADAAEAQKLRDKGMSTTAIAEKMQRNESSVRAMLAPGQEIKRNVLNTTADYLREQVKEKEFIDIGAHAESTMNLGISGTKLNTAVALLREEGYAYHKVKIPQLGSPGNFTVVKVLAPPGTLYKDIVTNPGKIKLAGGAFSDDGGHTIQRILPPSSLDSKRVFVRYGPDGGANKDGVIELRRGVDDISLGTARYAQVRIAVDGKHYLKGMAMYSDNIPEGHDVVFNTNKANKGDKFAAMKDLTPNEKGEIDEASFGAMISHQRHYKDARGNEHLSPINIVNQEGAWDEWSKSLSSQMLSKQSPSLAKKQLDEAYNRKKSEYDEIMSLTNPTIRKKLLESFADDADSSSVHLKAAELPRQRTQVILPLNSLKNNEVYAPNFRDGEQVVLVRYPHGGKFEIPELTVNNRNVEGNRLLKQAKDAVAIHPSVAERLSGADFDGDTVLVIPNNSRAVKTEPGLKGLKDFDPKAEYPKYEGMPVMTARTKGLKMGDVSNLITDMTLKGATNDELERAVKHSMVVIDAEKHELNWRQSAKDMRINELKTKYQRGPRSGADTLISQAKSKVDINERTLRKAQDGGPIDPVTGAKKYVPTGKSHVVAEHYVDPETGKKVYAKPGEHLVPPVNTKTGKPVRVVPEATVVNTEKITKMEATSDAHTLSSGTVMESIYADHANRLKALGNTARKSYLETPNLERSPSAAVAYAPQVKSLKAQLNIAQANAPLERQAQILANVTVKAKIQANPDMDDDDLKKVKGRALNDARIRTGAKKTRVQITPEEWNAIQSGAISNNFLKQILNNTDTDEVKRLATPRAAVSMTPSETSRAKAMLARGTTQADVADALGISVSKLNSALNPKGE